MNTIKTLVQDNASKI